eukprot:SM000158S02037  [mRNA]  locus=s158:232711:236300:- [translate_table: standard]
MAAAPDSRSCKEVVESSQEARYTTTSTAQDEGLDRPWITDPVASSAAPAPEVALPEQDGSAATTAAACPLPAKPLLGPLARTLQLLMEFTAAVLPRAGGDAAAGVLAARAAAPNDGCQGSCGGNGGGASGWSEPQRPASGSGGDGDPMVSMEAAAAVAKTAERCGAAAGTLTCRDDGTGELPPSLPPPGQAGIWGSAAASSAQSLLQRRALARRNRARQLPAAATAAMAVARSVPLQKRLADTSLALLEDLDAATAAALAVTERREEGGRLLKRRQSLETAGPPALRRGPPSEFRQPLQARKTVKLLLQPPPPPPPPPPPRRHTLPLLARPPSGNAVAGPSDEDDDEELEESLERLLEPHDAAGFAAATASAAIAAEEAAVASGGCSDGGVSGEASEEESAAVLRAHCTIRLFNHLRRRALQEEEARVCEEGRGSRRADFKAGKAMRERGLIFNPQPAIGHIPGMRVGHAFYSRQEMMMVGMHRHPQAGVDCIGGKRSPWGRHVATCIVLSGGYEDNLDGGEEFWYSVHGRDSGTHSIRGNAALIGSAALALPVRVVRRAPELNSYSGSVYTYDGLYLVEEWRATPGASGHDVYRFRLARMPGQALIAPGPMKASYAFGTSLSRDLVASDRPGLLLVDLSGGREVVPICVVDDTAAAGGRPPSVPPVFEYLSRVSYPAAIAATLAPAVGCSCGGPRGCVDPDACACAARNGGTFPYNRNGSLVEAKALVYECGPACACPPTCHNRVAQRGLTRRLEVFRTASGKGWGARSWDALAAGDFLCEYTGCFLEDADAECLLGRDDYLFDLDCSKTVTERWSAGDGLLHGDLGDGKLLVDKGGGERSAVSSERLMRDVHFCLDAAKTGNVARYFNHSCAPNLFVQCVLFDHHDVRAPHVCLFAMEHVPPLVELTYDYNYAVGTVRNEDGSVKRILCLCGAPGCRKRLL